MAFHHLGQGRSQVIQGRFSGGGPTIITPRPGPSQPQGVAHVQDAIHRGASQFYHHVAQRKAVRDVSTQAGTEQPYRTGNATLLPATFHFAPSIGQFLPPLVQRKMEAFFGADFSGIRIHVGPQAQQIGAEAFTRGNDIFFAPGRYMPEHSHGQRLLGHELAHVVQQRSGRVRNPFGNGVAVVQDQGLEAEADRMGIQAARQARRQPSNALQPFIAKGTTVFFPDNLPFNQQRHDKNNFKNALKALGGPTGTTLNATQEVSWLRFAENQAGFEMDHGSVKKGQANISKIKKQFNDQTKVYYYRNNQDIKDAAPAATKLLLTFSDMAEANSGEGLPVNATANELAEAKCVIEALESMNQPVPNTQAGTVGQWHTYIRGEGLDYRQDNNYVITYVKDLGLELIVSRVTKWADWKPANGNYIAMSFSSAACNGVGHAIGVVVTGAPDNRVKTIHDQQGLSPGKAHAITNDWNQFHVKYVFKIP